MRLSSIIAFVAILSGCGGPKPDASRAETSLSGDGAHVRFVNADPTLDKADVWFGDHKAFSTVVYRQVTPFTPLPAERRNFAVRVANQGQSLAEGSEGLAAGKHYTLVAMRHRDHHVVMRLLRDDVAAPGQGKAAVRFLNADGLAGELDLYPAGSRGEAYFDDVNFAEATDYRTVDAGVGFEIRGNESKHAGGVRVRQNAFAPGKRYTVIALGDGRGDYLLIEEGSEK